ncbi:MAG: hypothetical protein E7647_06845 [Ruminococcaceae bacterium]|nr:hypothetical protein [Oscillospiraceae bacterium]
MKRIIALFLVLITVCTALLACSKPEEGEIISEYTADDIVMKTENFSYTRGEFSVIFFLYVNEFFPSPEAVDFYNIDVDASFKDQNYDQNITWFDYFRDISLAYMETVLIRCEAAKAAGVELTEEDLDTIEAEVDRCVRFANDYDYTEEEYFNYRFGPDGSQKALREYLKKDALAARFDSFETDKYSFTDEDRTKYVEENREAFYAIDYISFTFDEDDDPNAKAAAEALARITDPAAFDGYILSYMTDTLKLGKESASTKDCYKSFKHYDEYSDFSKWAFDGAEEGSTYIKAKEVEGQYTVYLLTKAPSLREDLTKNVRVIMVDEDSHETSARAESYAEGLLEKWKEGEATEESFEALAKEETDDESGKATGGLIEGIAAGDSLPEGLCEWLYDSETVPGSTGVFDGSACYYVVYFVGNGEVKWRRDVDELLFQDKYTKKLEDLEATYVTEKFDEVIGSLDA